MGIFVFIAVLIGFHPYWLLPLRCAFLVKYCVLLTLSIVAIFSLALSHSFSISLSCSPSLVNSTPNTRYNSKMYNVKNKWFGVNCIGCVFMVSPPKKSKKKNYRRNNSVFYVQVAMIVVCLCVLFLYFIGTCSTLISNQLA